MNLAKPYFLFRPLQLVRRLTRQLRPPRSPIQDVRLPWGLSLRIDTREALGRTIWTTGVHEIAVTEATWRLLSPGDTAVDAGANIGYIAGAMAVRTGAEGRVLAIEPHPEVYRKLEFNVALFRRHPGIGAIHPLEAALSDRGGRGQLAVGETFQGHQALARLVEPTEGVETIDVRTERLDDLVGDDRVQLLKLDVEGHELRALEGAQRLLREGRLTHVIYEDHFGPTSPVHRHLLDRGYAVFRLGWTLAGPLLMARDRTGRADSYEPPNYLATVEPERCGRLLQRRGWQVL